jgi:hypothetical protein
MKIGFRVSIGKPLMSRVLGLDFIIFRLKCWAAPKAQEDLAKFGYVPQSLVGKV